jgi:hypothetical protein
MRQWLATNFKSWTQSSFSTTCALASTYYEEILKMKGASGLSMATTLKRKFVSIALGSTVQPAASDADGSTAVDDESAAVSATPAA